MSIVQFAYKISLCIIKIIFLLFSLCIPIKKNLVLFMAFHGRGVVDNPKALYLALSSDEKYKDYSVIWVVNNNHDDLPAKIKKVKYQSLNYFFYLARSKYWMINCKLPEYVHKKKSQVYIQTWHGTPLKRLGKDIVEAETKKSRSGRNQKEVKRSYLIDAKRYDFMVSPNSFCTEVFQSAFGVEKRQLVEIGYPRNDALYKPSLEKIKYLKEKYCIPENKNVLLYAPTWRDDDYKLEGYTFRFNLDLKKWKDNLSNYIILFKPHYLIVNHIKISDDMNDFIRVIDAQNDINELYLISDCLVTDYSSVFFDYALLNRPIYFYMYDLEKYENNLRGFYLNIHKDLPGGIYKDEMLLIQDIKSKAYDYKKLEAFNKRFNSLQTDHCSKDLLRLVLR